MVLLERYLHAVEGHLPARSRGDIITELREDLRAQFEDRAVALGRPLSEDEQAALLRPYGRPLLMAARYWPQRHLIGPCVFPFYLTTLKLALAVALLVHVVVVFGLAIAGRPLGDAAASLFNYPGAAVTIFLWVTVAFAVFELVMGQVRIGEDWDPRKLPRETTFVPRASRFDVGVELVVAALFVLWWSALPQRQYLLMGPGAEFLALAPIWHRLYAPVLVLAVLSMLSKSIALVRPDWVTFRFATGVMSSVAGVAIVAAALRAGDLLVPASGTVEAATLARALNLGLRISAAITAAIIIIAAVVDVRRFSRARAHRREGQSVHGLR